MTIEEVEQLVAEQLALQFGRERSQELFRELMRQAQVWALSNPRIADALAAVDSSRSVEEAASAMIALLGEVLRRFTN